VSAMVEVDVALTDWLKPFVEKLGHKEAAADVLGLRFGSDRAWRAQERGSDG